MSPPPPPRMSDNADTNGEDTTSSSSEEEKEGEGSHPVSGPSQNSAWTPVPHNGQVNGTAQPGGDGVEEEDDVEEEASCLPTIYFSHTVEPKKVSVVSQLKFLLVLACWGRSRGSPS